MRVRAAGIREVKAHLSELLRDVKRGQAWIITERGMPVAKLVPVAESGTSLAERLRRLEEAGLLEPAPREVRTVPPPLRIEPEFAQQCLRKDRGA
ncbi:MAG: type II toxin-antitoxin system Phd/YefM family antitoxin [Vulcanimicrobiaceae bacterium]